MGAFVTLPSPEDGDGSSLAVLAQERLRRQFGGRHGVRRLVAAVSSSRWSITIIKKYK